MVSVPFWYYCPWGSTGRNGLLFNATRKPGLDRQIVCPVGICYTRSPSIREITIGSQQFACQRVDAKISHTEINNAYTARLYSYKNRDPTYIHCSKACGGNWRYAFGWRRCSAAVTVQTPVQAVGFALAVTLAVIFAMAVSIGISSALARIRIGTAYADYQGQAKHQ
jgi:hypothetical protein